MQGNRCALCKIPIANPELGSGIKSDACLDHCHVTGNIRGVLCRNCNGIEGKVHNLARRGKRQSTALRFLENLLEYWKQHTESPSGVLHPLHKTEDQKRERRNKLARERRAKAKK